MTSKTMRFIYTILFCLIVVVPILAQNDTDAEDILGHVSEKYINFKTSFIDLELTIKIPDTEDDLKTKGKAWLKGDKFKIEFDERMMISNKETQWTYLKEVKEVQISDYDPSSITFLPSNIFNTYSEEYYYRVKEEYKNEDKNLIKIIELSPFDKDSDIFKILLSINTDKIEVVSTEIFEKSGMRYKYKILNLETNIDLSDNFFIFYPEELGVQEEDIIDLR